MSPSSSEIVRVLSSIEAFNAAVAESTPGGHVVRMPGVSAAVTPVQPQRSMFNSVVIESPFALAAAIDDLAERYLDAGVGAWTVWIPEGDDDSARILDAAGHVLDGAPRAMLCNLDDLPAPARRDDMTWSEHDIPATLIDLNERAFDVPAGDFHVALGGLRPPRARSYVAESGGAPVSACMLIEHEDDAEVTFVATPAEFRGRRFASRLMVNALLASRDRGCATATLQATKLGAPIYERMGFRDLGAVQMWERRTDGSARVTLNP